MNRGGPRGTGVSVLGPLLLPHVQWSRVLSLVLLPGFLLQSAPPNGNTRTCPRHGAVKDTRHPFLLRPRAQHEAGSGDSSEVHAEGGLSRSVPGRAALAWGPRGPEQPSGQPGEPPVRACGQLQVGGPGHLTGGGPRARGRQREGSNSRGGRKAGGGPSVTPSRSHEAPPLGLVGHHGFLRSTGTHAHISMHRWVCTQMHTHGHGHVHAQMHRVHTHTGVHAAGASTRTCQSEVQSGPWAFHAASLCLCFPATNLGP